MNEIRPPYLRFSNGGAPREIPVADLEIISPTGKNGLYEVSFAGRSCQESPLLAAGSPDDFRLMLQDFPQFFHTDLWSRSSRRYDYYRPGVINLAHIANAIEDNGQTAICTTSHFQTVIPDITIPELESKIEQAGFGIFTRLHLCGRLGLYRPENVAKMTSSRLPWIFDENAWEYRTGRALRHHRQMPLQFEQ